MSQKNIHNLECARLLQGVAKRPQFSFAHVATSHNVAWFRFSPRGTEDILAME